MKTASWQTIFRRKVALSIFSGMHYFKWKLSILSEKWKQLEEAISPLTRYF